MKYLKDVVTLQLDTEKCTGCGMCLTVCPQRVFQKSGSKVAIIDRDACMECGACALNCPTSAIKVDAGVGCASGLINEWLRERKLPGLKGSGCCD